MSAHLTPKRWVHVGRGAIHDHETQFGPSGVRIGDTPNLVAHAYFIPRVAGYTTAEEVAELIVRACAAHDDLVALLHQAVARIELANADGNEILSAWLPDARAALAKAGGA